MKRKLRRLGLDDDDPLSGVANLFDLGVVFALGFMLALISYIGLPELVARQDMTLVKNPGTPQMEIIRKKGTKIERFRLSKDRLGGEGEKLGVAYRLKSGEVVYVPEENEPP
ncbi:MAG TPA: hypothetical protein DCZ95_11380 [Verrucomicrobia bacterium]|nr:MAG: hypothetical protein A2X46_04220 [Lentisphaerae bacterium GWF2_57_35]HBA84686.1 hypothetical protein [Verrucomicrobiota bacterium]